MKLVYPDYYEKFTCIAHDCRHTCCAGWEIEIDPKTLNDYLSMDGEIGARLRENIVTDEDGNAQFRLAEGERCPFLNDRNLCELILTLGEDHLCQICTDHPRFRNFFSDRTEIGLGLCCEAAAKLILSQKERMHLCGEENETLTQEESGLLSLRQALLDRMQERTECILQRWRKLLSRICAEPEYRSPAQWAEVLSGLERLDEAWEERLKDLALCPDFDLPFLAEPEFETAMEQLSCYFLYRHLAGALLDGDISARVCFCVFSAAVIGAMFRKACERGEGTLEELAEIARQYSAEIEYSEENLCAILDSLDELL